MDRRTLTMNWDGLGDDDDDDRFFESFERISCAVPLDLLSSGSDDDEFDDSRMSFASAMSSSTISSSSSIEDHIRGFQVVAAATTAKTTTTTTTPPPMLEEYNMWMGDLGSIKDRRKRLLQGMGLSSNKDLLRLASTKLKQALSKKIGSNNTTQLLKPTTTTTVVDSSASEEETKHEPSPCSTAAARIVLVRSRSDGDIESFSVNTKRRKEELIGSVSKQRLTRTSSSLLAATYVAGVCQFPNSIRISPAGAARNKSSIPLNGGGALTSVLSNSQFGAFFLIKNLDTGNEFIVKEFDEDGMWNRLSDLQTGKQLTMEEFEKSVGYSPVVKELMRRANVAGNNDDDDDGRKVTANSYLSKSFRYSKRRGVAFLKNIKGVANSMGGLIADKDREFPPPLPDQQQQQQRAATNNKNNNSSSQWVKVRQHGKSCKEFTGLHLCQEIQAHEGSIWTIRFSIDGHYLASAGEDRVIHVWEVQECEVTSMRMPPDDPNSASSTPLHPMMCSSPDRPPLADVSPLPSERRKKGKSPSTKKRGNGGTPDYVQVPETVFSLSEKPICSFTGHQDDVLDLSWSKSQLLLSSSMDKTVRLWDIETKSCLKLFAHNDYVTCIQFNPVDDDYFISGSLDAKVRIWNVPDRQVVDWTDLHEMVTAVCYTPDGQGALVGSHKGSCRWYSIDDCKLDQKDQIDIQNKKKQPKKVTGFQFVPGSPSEVLITSADSRIRISENSDIIHKFKGFRNTSSQISASFSPDGKYVISASEDSQVYIWKRDESKNTGTGGKSKGSVTTQAHEHFQCRDVSVAIPWPGSIKNEPPMVEVQTKKNAKRAIPQPLSNNGSPTREENSNSKRQLPPLPRKNSTAAERVLSSCPDEELGNDSSRIDSGIGISGDSFTSASSSIRYGDSPSISASSSSPSQSWSSSWSWFDGGNSNGGHAVPATAWGLVIVTAGLGGEIRAYQNFGLPLKVGRQAALFKDLT